MEHEASNAELKRRLLKEVTSFFRQDGLRWKAPIVETLRELRMLDAQAVLFGGTLRSLLAPRIFNGKPGRPRDVDIVVSGVSVNLLKERFEQSLIRETRFGGLQLRRRDWQFDVWPLQQTWAFVRDSVADPSFAALPLTTFFNLEAIAVDVWPRPGRSRQIYSGDDQFFTGILTRTLEINREENPFPELCVLRALVMSSELSLRIGPRLARYIVLHGASVTPDAFVEVQRKHYGQYRKDVQTLRTWVDQISEMHARDPSSPIKVPSIQQLAFWPEYDKKTTVVRVHSVST
jgi:hypothetical protein